MAKIGDKIKLLKGIFDYKVGDTGEIMPKPEPVEGKDYIWSNDWTSIKMDVGTTTDGLYTEGVDYEVITENKE